MAVTKPGCDNLLLAQIDSVFSSVLAGSSWGKSRTFEISIIANARLN